MFGDFITQESSTTVVSGDVMDIGVEPQSWKQDNGLTVICIMDVSYLLPTMF
jgi:hypothetical protein